MACKFNFPRRGSETDLQAKFLIPMAISLAFGILFATTITFILVPCLYLIQDDFVNWLMPVKKRDKNTEQTPALATL